MEVENIDVHDFLSASQEHLIIDVRAPIEFFKGHVSGAINIPLFEDIERAEIGTLYKQKGKDVAVMRGFEIVSPKLTAFIQTVKDNSSKKEVFVYCFRGGMRSNSFAWLLNTAGLDAKIMRGGYKAYRNHLIDYFTEKHELILLGGATGSAKTKILHELQNKIPVVDLEKLANHKGSAFGGIDQPAQLPQQVFESNFYQALLLQKKKTFLIEDESMSIGYNKIPYPFWLQMKVSPIIKLNVPFELRVNFLVEDYGNTSVEKLKKSLLAISSQIGPDNTTLCLKNLDAGNLHDVAQMALKYYDKAYTFNFTKRDPKSIIELDTDTADIKINANKVKLVFEQTCKASN